AKKRFTTEAQRHRENSEKNFCLRRHGSQSMVLTHRIFVCSVPQCLCGKTSLDCRSLRDFRREEGARDSGGRRKAQPLPQNELVLDIEGGRNRLPVQTLEDDGQN